MENLRRRTLFGVALGGSGAALAACGDGSTPSSHGSTTPPTSASSSATAAPATSARQVGVDTPVPRQKYVAARILGIKADADPARVLADLGRAATRAMAKAPASDQLTITIGIGPHVVRAAKGPHFVGAADLPEFAQDRIEDGALGGDVLVQVNADRRATPPAVATALVAGVHGLTPGWGIDGFRGQTNSVGARNLLGFYDGVSVPTTPSELDADVWTRDDDRLPDATVCVVRRMRLDRKGFERLTLAKQEAAIGRTKQTGAPLSGGTINTAVDLQAKSPAGVYDIPLDAHVRRAHPFVSGAEKLMLRRSYSYRNSADDEGLAFICFQRTLDQFVKTQNSIDQLDRLMDFAVTTGSATFLVPPAWSDDAPLGTGVLT